MDKTEEIIVTKKQAKRDYIYALGRRKSSTAEVRLYKKDATVWGTTSIKTGEIIVNNKAAIEYFGKSFEKKLKEPFLITSQEGKFAVAIKVSGGGKMGQ